MNPIQNDTELDRAVEELDQLLINGATYGEHERFTELADAIEEYETRTDILNRPRDNS